MTKWLEISHMKTKAMYKDINSTKINKELVTENEKTEKHKRKSIDYDYTRFVFALFRFLNI